ncbi:nucleobindin-2-like isoform X2 [Diadema antillarum]|uniref:nucleobindin-2-like isoform X2 n=1 Tax=Diadema antillarum TaxID=105358 RepID=UPI003A86D680
MATSQLKLALLLLVIVQLAHLAPLDPKPAEEKQEEPKVEGVAGEGDNKEAEPLGLEYERYLREVIQVLEADPEMKAKMDEMDTDDLLSGKFGKQLNNVGNHIRSQLDDLKRKEIQRLRIVARKKMEEHAGADTQTNLLDFIAHVDFRNEHTFEEADLNNLLQKATKDLEENDRQRRQEFKRYEMEKELKRRTELKHMEAKERAEAERQYREEREQLRHHSKVNHPGSKKQLEEVWEKTDHLEKGDFNPKTFFFLHDANSDGFLDAFELEALFIKEVEKIYQGRKNVDVQEKFEELSRMREHVVNQIDGNKDKMVSLEEFMEAAAASDFDDESEWQDLNKEDQFTEEELNAYQEELRRTLEETKAKMAEAGDNFVKVRQPQRQEPVAMDQGHAQQIKDDLSKGLPPIDTKEGKINLGVQVVPQAPGIVPNREQQQNLQHEAQPPAMQVVPQQGNQVLQMQKEHQQQQNVAQEQEQQPAEQQQEVQQP